MLTQLYLLVIAASVCASTRKQHLMKNDTDLNSKPLCCSMGYGFGSPYFPGFGMGYGMGGGMGSGFGMGNSFMMYGGGYGAYGSDPCCCCCPTQAAMPVSYSVASVPVMASIGSYGGCGGMSSYGMSGMGISGASMYPSYMGGYGMGGIGMSGYGMGGLGMGSYGMGSYGMGNYGMGGYGAGGYGTTVATVALPVTVQNTYQTAMPVTVGYAASATPSCCCCC
ncbi:uncharacterized protein MONOS_9022 [Monocercomonoides exilis]|uniref:uncharacterized protein n=1 Tax=Monocercomonoides exilis TaxID=2049356 RepID=UPI00355A7D2C|nr:hypothetical protein MONOS_9022 [Monocercomonoides exilis]|eukprot:MONOS_9022.1-p1 / transcript=MONOS_9022.1 / gene=MONOS_9022 / organism=Monocercomonoides_exilis_PA203 / gene_product=unspecified product / transcript_product=unspecified product / location=Mono_scaffold00358:29667-30464(+) / protein_length=223 / sequence_SO=supercontig / SO=protein_coding / is_pseudo=false